MAKGGKARERLEARRRQSQIIGQLNSLQAAGYSADDIRAAGAGAWNKLGKEALSRLSNAGQNTPGQTTPGPTAADAQSPYANATAAPAWATQSLAKPPELQWWQRGQPGRPAAKTPGNFQNAIEALATRRDNPNLTAAQIAGRGRGTNRNNADQTRPPAIFGGAYTPSAGATPYIPTWLNPATMPILGGAYTPSAGVTAAARNRNQGQATTAGTMADTGTGTGSKGGRLVDPNTGIPDFPMLEGLGEGGGGGYYSSWYRRRRRRGGGGKKTITGRAVNPNRGPSNYVPSAGLTSWNIG